MKLTIEMHNPVGQIMDELAMKEITQASVAITYAFVMAQEPDADFAAINAAIRARWKGKTALTSIKEAAWKHMDEWSRNAARSLHENTVDEKHQTSPQDESRHTDTHRTGP